VTQATAAANQAHVACLLAREPLLEQLFRQRPRKGATPQPARRTAPGALARERRPRFPVAAARAWQ
jgi:hypothetical protein